MDLDDRLKLQKSEEDTIKFWRSGDIDDEVSEFRKGGRNVYLPRAPVNTKDHLEWNEIFINMVYDTLARFYSISGYNVRNGVGFESMNNKVEKLSIKDMDDIECLKTIDDEDKKELLSEIDDRSERYIESTRDELKKLGVWMIDEFEYQTCSKDFLDPIWWTIDNLYEKDLLIQRRKPLKFCPECKTSLSDIEVTSTSEVKEEALVKIPLASGKNRYFLTYLEDMWKYPASLNIVVHPDEEYAIVKIGSEEDPEQLVVLKSTIEDMLEIAQVQDYEVQKVVTGEALEGLTYRYPLGDKIPIKTEEYGKLGKVILSNDIRLDGTGIVPLTPYYDKLHWKIAEKEDLSRYDPLMMNGHFDDGPRMNKYSGISAAESESVILDDLESKGLLFSRSETKKDVERCSTCKNRLITYPKREWFFDSSSIDYDNELENIKPSNKDVFFGEWPLTRDNIWGHPFPMWKCDCGTIFTPSQHSDLEELSTEDIDFPLTILETPDIQLGCPDCGKIMTWIEKTIDPSFIRACSPWAQIGYPCEEKGHQSWWPAKVLVEDDSRVGSQLDESVVLSLSLFGENSSEKVLPLGTVVSSIDHKDVSSLVKRHGYDSLRGNLFSEKPLWTKRYVKGEDIEYPHPLVKVLKNIQVFLRRSIAGSELDLEDLEENSFSDEIDYEDEWILSRLESTKEKLTKAYSNYRFEEVIDSLQNFVLDDFAQTYMISVRDRLDEARMDQELDLLCIFYELLDDLSKLIAPVFPMLAENIYREFYRNKDSIFLEDWPENKEERHNEVLEEEMAEVSKVIDSIILTKKRSDLPEIWPLQRIVYKGKSQDAVELAEKFERIIRLKAKVKEIEILYPDEGWDEAILRAEPKRDVIRKSYQHWVSKIATMLEKKSPENIKEGMEKGGFEMGLEGQIVEIDPSMVNFIREMPDGFEKIDLDDQEIFVDLRVSDEIWDEETAREIELRIKSMRMDLDIADEDEIDVYISGTDNVLDALEPTMKEIRDEVGARKFRLKSGGVEKSQYILGWDVNGEEVEIGIDPLYKTEVIGYLTDICGLDEEKGLEVYQAGYTSVDSLFEATREELLEIEGLGEGCAEKVVNSFEEKKEEDQVEEKLKEDEEAEEGSEEKAEELEKPETDISGEKEGLDIDIEEEDGEYLCPHEDCEKTYQTVGWVERHYRDKHMDVVKDQSSEKKIEETEKRKTRLPEGVSKCSTHLIEEEDSERSFEIFKQILETGEKGLCVTRDYPDKIKEEYDLEDVDMIWLSNVDRDDVIRPKSLEKLSLALENFLARDRGVILFNGVEYLITNNDFRTVLHLVQSIKDQVAINDSILVIPINPNILEDNQLDQINGVVDVIIDARN